MSTVSLPRYTPEEYLALERVAGHKSEYYRGEIFAMAGASEAHNLIVGNLIRHLGNALEGQPCRIYPTDMRVKCPTGLYTYPDVSIVCGERAFDDDDRRDTLLNPIVIIEVLSPSTEAFDRGKKFGNYRSLPSLVEYVLIAQDEMSVEKFVRPSGDSEAWFLTAQTNRDDVVTFGSCGATLRIADIYAGVDFPAPSTGIAPLTVFPDSASPR